jgi:hypothetical protein
LADVGNRPKAGALPDLRKALLSSRFAGEELHFRTAKAHFRTQRERGVAQDRVAQGCLNASMGGAWVGVDHLVNLLIFWLIATKLISRKLIFRRLRGVEWAGRENLAT